MTAVVGLDVGTTGVKALAIDEEGRVLAKAEEPYPLSTPRPGWSEQDPEDWWRASQRAVAALPHADAIGYSGQMHGLVVLDERERVLRPAILWNDQRTAAECVEIEERVGLERLIALTGNRALPGFTAPKLLWLRKHEPDVYARIAHILLPKDYVRLRLTGVHAIDAADDQAAAALGVGIVEPGALSVVLGTSGVVFAALDGFVADPLARAHVFCHAVPETWHAMGVMLSAAESLRWLRGVLGGEYDELLADAAAIAPGAGGVLFAPYLSGERTPHVDPDVRAAFQGLSLGHGRGHVVRAVLEGVAC